MRPLKFKVREIAILKSFHPSNAHTKSTYFPEILGKKIEIIEIRKSRIKGYYSGAFKVVGNDKYKYIYSGSHKLAKCYD